MVRDEDLTAAWNSGADAGWAALPADTVVFPGHRYSMPSSAPMEAIRESNYVFRPRSKDQWMMMFGH